MTNPNGRFGRHGGQYIPETLMNAVIELERYTRSGRTYTSNDVTVTVTFTEYRPN